VPAYLFEGVAELTRAAMTTTARGILTNRAFRTTYDHCNLRLEECNNGVHSIGSVRKKVERAWSEYRTERGQAMSEKDGIGPSYVEVNGGTRTYYTTGFRIKALRGVQSCARE
jgi:hypothetical protein